MEFVTDTSARTPTQKIDERLWVKRDDLFSVNGARGSKLRAAMLLAKGQRGVVGFGSRIATIGTYITAAAEAVGTPCAYVTASGKFTQEMEFAKNKNAEIIQVNPGYLSHCKFKARQIARERNWKFMPFDLESHTAVMATAAQVKDSIPTGCKRIVITVGGGVSAAGVIWGLKKAGIDIPMLGVSIGKCPLDLLSRQCPFGWRDRMKIAVAPEKYEDKCEEMWHGIRLDPHYEAKCVQFLRPGDLFWLVGVRPLTAEGG